MAKFERGDVVEQVRKRGDTIVGASRGVVRKTDKQGALVAFDNETPRWVPFKTLRLCDVAPGEASRRPLCQQPFAVLAEPGPSPVPAPLPAPVPTPAPTPVETPVPSEIPTPTIHTSRGHALHESAVVIVRNTNSSDAAQLYARMVVDLGDGLAYYTLARYDGKAWEPAGLRRKSSRDNRASIVLLLPSLLDYGAFLEPTLRRMLEDAYIALKAEAEQARVAQREAETAKARTQALANMTKAAEGLSPEALAQITAIIEAQKGTQ